VVRQSLQTAGSIQELVMDSITLQIPNLIHDEAMAQSQSARLASLAVRAMLEEAELTPKPALVDERGPGAHRDLSLTLMRRSARSLYRYFEVMALTSFQKVLSQSLREELGTLGRAAESSMLQTTGGVNTHRGSIWTLGLLASSAAMGLRLPAAVAVRAARLASFPDRNAPNRQSNGSIVKRLYRISGASGEAQAGFPHVVAIGLPMLYRSRLQGASETQARLNALLAIMMSLNDTCLLHRGGLRALHTAQSGATAVLASGGTATARGWRLLEQLDRDLVELNASPGGSADLLAATLFLDFITDRNLMAHEIRSYLFSALP
jgi:triphosphoribosyl-dephospho-CoA synthase